MQINYIWDGHLSYLYENTKAQMSLHIQIVLPEPYKNASENQRSEFTGLLYMYVKGSYTTYG